MCLIPGQCIPKSSDVFSIFVSYVTYFPPFPFLLPFPTFYQDLAHSRLPINISQRHHHHYHHQIFVSFCSTTWYIQHEADSEPSLSGRRFRSVQNSIISNQSVPCPVNGDIPQKEKLTRKMRGQYKAPETYSFIPFVLLFYSAHHVENATRLIFFQESLQNYINAGMVLQANEREII